MKTLILTFALLILGFLSLKSQTLTINADGPTSFCYGDSVHLCVNPAIYHNYFWNNGEIASCITVTQNGNYFAIVFDSVGNVDSSLQLNPVHIIVHHPQPIINVRNDTLFCTVSFNSYQWYLNNLPISGATNQSFLATQNGNYYVKVTDSFGCTGISVMLDSNPHLSINEVLKEKLSISPNPFTNEFTISLPENAGNTEISIYDLTGRALKKLIMNNDKSRIDLSDLAKGVYFISVKGRDWVKNEKVVKE